MPKETLIVPNTDLELLDAQRLVLASFLLRFERDGVCLLPEETEAFDGIQNMLDHWSDKAFRAGSPVGSYITVMLKRGSRREWLEVDGGRNNAEDLWSPSPLDATFFGTPKAALEYIRRHSGQEAAECQVMERCEVRWVPGKIIPEEDRIQVPGHSLIEWDRPGLEIPQRYPGGDWFPEMSYPQLREAVMDDGWRSIIKRPAGSSLTLERPYEF